MYIKSHLKSFKAIHFPAGLRRKKKKNNNFYYLAIFKCQAKLYVWFEMWDGALKQIPVKTDKCHHGSKGSYFIQT